MELYRKIKFDLIVSIFGGCIFVAALNLYFNPKDDSDSEDKRSNMLIRTDYKTGCQYLESTRGYLTPRLDSDKNQICN